MRSVGTAALIGALTFLMPATASLAADLPPPPIFEYKPIKIGHAWYLRGHIGMSNQDMDGLEHASFSSPAFYEWLDEGNFTSAGIFGMGIGFRHNDYLRFDLTGEYRGKAELNALDRYDSDSNPPDFDAGVDDAWGVNDYTAKKSELLFLANAYFDLAKWHKVTPYIGGGIGFSRNTISNFTDTNVIQGGGGYASTDSKWSFAWALHAGLGFKATEKMTVDLGYSFVSLGDAQTGTFYNVNGTCVSCTSVKFDNLYSHDFKLGIRYALGGDHGGGHYDPYPPVYPPVVKY